jgi:hypothetical protein
VGLHKVNSCRLAVDPRCADPDGRERHDLELADHLAVPAQDTRPVLAELGYTDAEMATLRSQRAVDWPEQGPGSAADG